MGFKKIVFLTTMPIEFKAVTTHLTDLVEKVTSEGTIYEVGYYESVDGYVWEVSVGETGHGNINAAIGTLYAIKSINPAYIFSVGLAVGIKDVELGDVVVSSNYNIPGYNSSLELVALATEIAKSNQWLDIASVGKMVSYKKMINSPELIGGDAVAIDNNGGDGVLQGIKDNYNQKVQGIVIRGISELLRVKPDKTMESIAAQNVADFAFTMLDKL